MKHALLGIVLGGGLGGVIGYFGRCASGTCPLTSNPYVGALFGAALGLAVAVGQSD